MIYDQGWGRSSSPIYGKMLWSSKPKKQCTAVTEAPGASFITALATALGRRCKYQGFQAAPLAWMSTSKDLWEFLVAKTKCSQ